VAPKTTSDGVDFDSCSNKLHAKFVFRGTAVYRANELNFSI